MGHSTILTPRRHPRRAKIAPRRLQDLPKTILKSVFSLLKIAFDFDSFWDRFWLHFGSPNASLLAPFSHQNLSKNRCEIGMRKRSLQDCPKCAQEPPQTPHRAPPDPLRPPKTTKIRPKTPPKRSKIDLPKKAPQAPGVAGTDFTHTLRFPKGQAKIFGERPVIRARAFSIRPLPACGTGRSKLIPGKSK